MKYTVKGTEVKAIVDVISMIDDGEQVVCLMGVGQEKDDQMVCCIRVTGRNDQITSKFLAVPEDEPECVEKESFVVNAKQFAGVLSAMLAYNSNTIIENTENSVLIGVENVTQVAVDKIPDENCTPEIAMGRELPILFQLSAKSKDFANFAKAGCMFTDTVKGNGCENVALFLNLEVGELSGYSTNSFLIGRSKGKVTVDTRQNHENALEAYLKEKGESKERILILIPEKSFSHLLKVIETAGQFAMIADARHLFIGAGRNVYALTLGAQHINLEGPIAKFEEQGADAVLKIETKELLRAVQTLKKINQVKHGSDKVCLSVTAEGTSLCLTAGTDCVKIPGVDISEGGIVDFNCYSHLLERAVSSMTTEHITMQLLSQQAPVKISEDASCFDTVYMLKARKTETEKAAGETGGEAEMSE